MWKASSLTRDKGEVATVEEGKTGEHSIFDELFDGLSATISLEKGLVKPKYDSIGFLSFFYWQDFKNVSCVL